MLLAVLLEAADVLDEPPVLLETAPEEDAKEKRRDEVDPTQTIDSAHRTRTPRLEALSRRPGRQ